MKEYLDNNIVSGRVRSDLAADEMTAVRKIERAWADGKIEVETSRETEREQNRTKNEELRAALEQDRANVPLVKEDHQLRGIRAQFGYGWFNNSPILTEMVDESLFAAFKAAGLEDADARHLMYAVHNGCDRFLTVDPDFLNRRQALDASCRGLRIVKPSELVAELESAGAAVDPA